MRIVTYSNGGGVIHGITGKFKGKCSAYFDKNGNLVDAGQITDRGYARGVKENGPIWKMLEAKVKVLPEKYLQKKS